MKANEFINEAPLPPDWDPAQFQQDTTFKSRLAYALERAKKIGAGSSRVAMIIDYEGRQTVLKVAKNQKGLAQNNVESSILNDNYATSLGILIPIIDYDTKHVEPLWVQTELAQPASEKQLCQLMGCKRLYDLIELADAIAGKSRRAPHQTIVNRMLQRGYTEEQIDQLTEYAESIADLSANFNVETVDLSRKANWGLYRGKPVIIDVGFNSDVLQQYYK